MRVKSLLFLLAITIIFSMNIFTTSAQEENIEVNSRGTFLSTRPIKPPKETDSKTKAITKPVTRPVTKDTTKNGDTKAPKNIKAPVGLGYTIYLRSSDGDPISVDPNRVFKSGDAIRVTLEPNINGFTYIFHTENDGQPQMLYPDYRLNKGDNAVREHVPYEIPSSNDPDPRYRWFVFDENPATEKLFIVVSRVPLTDVPTREALLKICDQPNSCPWKPSTDIWKKVSSLNNVDVVASVSKELGKAQSKVERESINRSLGLMQDAPEPTIIRINNSTQNKMLVTSIDLIHK